MLLYMMPVLVGLIFGANAFAVDINLLANNKEVSSKILTRQHERSISQWLKKNEREDLTQKARASLASTLKEFERQDSYCDLGFTHLLKENALSDRVISRKSEFDTYVAFLRKSNLIDDLLFRNILSSLDVTDAFVNPKERVSPPNKPQKITEDLKDLDLETLYSGFRTWPDEATSCSLGTYFKITKDLTWKNTKERDRLLRKTNRLAYERKLISEETFSRLEIIRQRKALDWPIYINGYLEVVANAKDKLSPTGKPEVDPSTNSTKYSERKEKLTRRGRLYRNFDSTQVMMLAEIIQKTSKRIDAHSVEINFRYQASPNSDGEIYVLSPMERYRLSIKMLRKDMGEIMRSELFAGTNVEYGDLVTAAYETGLIRSEELDLILKFEDFWDPKTPKWKTYANFTFSILGTASFYLPPPWNIVAAIALVVTQTQLDRRSQTPDEDDNWNAVI